MKVKSLSCVRLLVTPWTAAYQAPPSMGFSRQEDWTGVPLPSPESSLTMCKKIQTLFTVFFKNQQRGGGVVSLDKVGYPQEP